MSSVSWKQKCRLYKIN